METLQYPEAVKARTKHRCNYCHGIIEKGETYERSVHKYDGVYTWKSHVKCSEIASKLKMFDYADEVVTDDFFRETIECEYNDIMAKTNPELYESKEFKRPSFHEQIDFVVNHHLIPDSEKISI